MHHCLHSTSPIESGNPIPIYHCIQKIDAIIATFLIGQNNLMITEDNNHECTAFGTITAPIKVE